MTVLRNYLRNGPRIILRDTLPLKINFFKLTMQSETDPSEIGRKTTEAPLLITDPYETGVWVWLISWKLCGFYPVSSSSPRRLSSVQVPYHREFGGCLRQRRRSRTERVRVQRVGVEVALESLCLWTTRRDVMSPCPRTWVVHVVIIKTFLPYSSAGLMEIFKILYQWLLSPTSVLCLIQRIKLRRNQDW